jgi:hypothetical protein
MRKAHRIIFRKLTRLLGSSSCRGEDSTADWMSKKKGKNKVAWTNMVQDRNK